MRGWKNFKKGKKYAASNPRYCYEWSFIIPKKRIVVNLWHDHFELRNKQIIWKGNARAWASKVTGREKRRSIELDERIQTAIRENLQIRVIICTRKKRTKRTVAKRCLDPTHWTVLDYNQNTGQCELIRGNGKRRFEIKKDKQNAVNDLTDIPEGNRFPDRAKLVSQTIKRDRRVRGCVLKRANGRCEYCGARGFPTTDGRFYLETHHIIALADSGHDTIDNVIGLCPQHHRQAHYGADAESLEAKFISRLRFLNRR